jgi:hypothetical protein
MAAMSVTSPIPSKFPKPADLAALGATGSPVAETSVRHALPAEAPAIGVIQAAAWRRAYRDVLPAEVLEQFEPAEFASAGAARCWRRARPATG